MSNLHLYPTPRVLQTLFSSWWSVPAVIFLKSRFLYTPASYYCVFTTLGKSSIMSSAAYCSRKTLLVNGSLIQLAAILTVPCLRVVIMLIFLHVIFQTNLQPPNYSFSTNSLLFSSYYLSCEVSKFELLE